LKKKVWEIIFMDTILISMGHRKNSEIIGKLLEADFQVIYMDDDSLQEDFSLLITDLPSWKYRREALIIHKEREKPLFLPYLLVASQKDLKIASKDIWGVFDEVITIPITRAVLKARVNVLVRNRQLSLQVDQLLQDKNMLMKEIHHRVKNNLMVISSLLSLQSRYISDPKSVELFRESEKRARSMALIHERLYRSSDQKKIEMGEYISTMARDLFDTYSTSEGQVNLEMDVEESMVDVNAAIPLGLILNEIITNSLKYAFPEGKKGTITVIFRHKVDEFLLEIRDDGVGLPEDFDVEKSDSLGMQLITSLSQQLGAEVEIKRGMGTCFRIIFQDAQYS
jgi:two-component sensor histidine kinase